MPTFDIVSKIDGQTLDNAINTAKKEILNRFDFHDSKSTIDLDKKSNLITIVTENNILITASHKRVRYLPNSNLVVGCGAIDSNGCCGLSFKERTSKVKTSLKL